jgi:hypothetical protein
VDWGLEREMRKHLVCSFRKLLCYVGNGSSGKRQEWKQETSCHYNDLGMRRN